MNTSKKTPLRHVLAAVVVALLAMGLAPMAAWATSADQALTAGGGLQAQEEAPAIDVFMTISDRGTLVLPHEKVTVSDLNKDGKITFDEALQATHELYCPDGYATTTGEWGYQVTKLWGVDSTSNMFYNNNKMTDSVDVAIVAAGDNLVAGVMKDQTAWSDCYAYFDKTSVAVKKGKEFTLTLKADSWGTVMAASGVQVGTWNANSKFTPLSGKKTDKDGKVTLSFDEPGQYIVSAEGTIPENAFGGKNCPVSAAYCLVTVAADPINVYVTVSQKGTLALAHQAVKVTDLNKDSLITYDEALQAAHEKYCPAGKKGYATEEAAWGVFVTKLWGEETGGSAMFYQNDESIPVSVGAQLVSADDDLVAATLVDTTTWSDNYTYFSRNSVSAKVGEKVSLRLRAVSMFPVETINAANVTIGTWSDGKFTPIKGTATSKNGTVALKFSEAGTYVVSAAGTVDHNGDCPIIAPYCIVKVTKADNPMKVTSTTQNVKYEKVAKKAVIVSPLKVTKAKGTKVFKVTEWTTAKAKKCMKLNASNGKVTVKKGTAKGTYKFKVKVTAKGNKGYKAKSVTKKVVIKVTK